MSFDKVIGQDLAITILKKQLKGDRLSHAYLFLGEQGVGKDIAAFEFAKAINCQEESADACEQCISCRKADNQNHPDIIEIKPDGKWIKIDQIRALQREILYKPYESRWKIYIIYQAEQLNLEAANSLLKILEEPPQYAIIILTINNAENILPTILSRCQLIRFRLLPDQLIKEQLNSDYELSPEKSQLITSLAAGRYKDAVQLIEDEEKLAEREDILKLVLAIKELDQVTVFEVAEKLLEYKEQINQVLDLFLLWYRDLLLVKLTQIEGLVNADYKEQLIKEAKGYKVEEIEEIIKIIQNTNNVIKKYNVNLQLTIEVMLLKLSRLGRQNRWQKQLE
ncbi:DNA polymerase III subunit delta' [Natroniella sulfidigena]|uniref:DNA polymerase III subunit delta' n=1 Tax=Natroniella sulfidigena TaxID=723921 RepID=UPI00200A6F79|nr:DNA polymerase III subunit delta' [Natroniella sulfidigena]MCK8817091.1 DNA polymerase III subunit delta' [Natroniella sulfidigena]